MSTGRGREFKANAKIHRFYPLHEGSFFSERKEYRQPTLILESALQLPTRGFRISERTPTVFIAVHDAGTVIGK